MSSEHCEHHHWPTHRVGSESQSHRALKEIAHVIRVSIHDSCLMSHVSRLVSHAHIFQIPEVDHLMCYVMLPFRVNGECTICADQLFPQESKNNNDSELELHVM